MAYGIFAGIFWALGTVTLSFALERSPFVSGAEAAFLAPFVSTFLHDACSALWASAFNGVRGRWGDVLRALRTRDGKVVALAALLGGPVGMTGYVLTIRSLGASVGAVASAAYPAVGAILAHIFLRERMQWYRWIFLLLTLGGVYALSFSPEAAAGDFRLGVLGVAMCALGWGIEGVLLTKSLRSDRIQSAYALQIRQTVSALFYAAVLLPALRGWGFTSSLFATGNGKVFLLLALAALCSTLSYLFYYKALAMIGASKAMALNVTYAAWAVVFTVLLRRDSGILNVLSVSSTIVVLVFGILTAADFRELTAKIGKKRT